MLETLFKLPVVLFLGLVIVGYVLLAALVAPFGLLRFLCPGR